MMMMNVMSDDRDGASRIAWMDSNGVHRRGWQGLPLQADRRA
jgi:hypothetical protein